MSIDLDQCVADILDIGHCVLPGHFPKPAIGAFHDGFLPLLAKVAERIPEGNRRANRWAIGLPFAPPFYQSAFFNDAIVNEIVSRILGESMFIGYYGTDTPVAGSEDQQVHADIRPLFPEQPDLRYPPPTLSVRFTTVDMTLENGPYSTSERTQQLSRDEAQAKIQAGEIELAPLLLRAGDVLISDARTLHRGTANRTDAPRPIRRDRLQPRLVSPRWRAAAGGERGDANAAGIVLPDAPAAGAEASAPRPEDGWLG